MKTLLSGIASRILNGSIGQTMARMCPDPITHVETRDPVVALTFDDGPHAVYTHRLLRILENNGAKATFFMVGESVRRNPEVVRKAAGAGHAIGNHSDTHLNLSQITSPVWRLKQLWRCKKALGPYGKDLFRPPFGAHNDTVKLDAVFMGYKIILWNVSAQDWVSQQPEEISKKIIDRLTPGSIVLLHDAIYKSHPAVTVTDRGPMLDGLEKAFDVLRGRLHFVTVPELLRAGQPRCDWPRP